MFEFVITVMDHLAHFVLTFCVLNACVHLRDICDATQELLAISYHVSEIRRRLIAIERLLPPVKEIKAD